MKVTNNISGANLNALKSKGNEKVSEESKAGKANSKVDAKGTADVKLSQHAMQMKKAEKIARETPDVDMAKVEKYRALIEKGQYNIDASKIADKLVDDHLVSGMMELKK